MYRKMLLILFNLFSITKLNENVYLLSLRTITIYINESVSIYLFKKLNAKLPNTRGRSRISRGRQFQSGHYLLFGIIFAKNCMKMKKNGGGIPCASRSSIQYRYIPFTNLLFFYRRFCLMAI